MRQNDALRKTFYSIKKLAGLQSTNVSGCYGNNFPNTQEKLLM